MDPWSLGISGVVSLLGMLFGGKSDSGSQMTPEQKDMLTRALRVQENRTAYQNPLYEEATTLARALLPKSARPASYQSSLWGLTTPGVGVAGGRPNPSAPTTGQAVPRGTATDDAIAALAAGLPSPTTSGRSGIGIRNEARLYQRPAR